MGGRIGTIHAELAAMQTCIGVMRVGIAPMSLCIRVVQICLSLMRAVIGPRATYIRAMQTCPSRLQAAIVYVQTCTALVPTVFALVAVCLLPMPLFIRVMQTRTRPPKASITVEVDWIAKLSVGRPKGTTRQGILSHLKTKAATSSTPSPLSYAAIQGARGEVSSLALLV
ncbi:MAG: hypothetical protein QOH70_793 [Blastocatellia bacterium]|jgi:hypothetical protein|nr:hypothetical protein [Blastocatellia bacterium]